MVFGVDIVYIISSTITIIIDQLQLSTISIVICINLYSLYKCLVKLGTIKEKHLMIDIMAIRQLYKQRELQEIQWINGLDNPVDAMTKSNANKALESFVDTNKLIVRIEDWVKRAQAIQTWKTLILQSLQLYYSLYNVLLFIQSLQIYTFSYSYRKPKTGQIHREKLPVLRHMTWGIPYREHQAYLGYVE